MKQTNSLQQTILSINRVLFGLIGLFALTVIISDAWNLLPPSVVLQRWTLASLLLVANGVVWYACRQTKSTTLLQAYVWILTIVTVAIATVLVYSQRGMASKAVALYVIPLLIVAALRSRVALITTALLSVAAYSLALVRYFVTSPGEGYKVELYAEILFFGGFFFVVALLLWVHSRKRP